ncbi:MAG TPA: N-acetyl-gamma-glutamyl-phosphate reductase [Candidatus Methylomirabilis sp.]|nr:N-acetyl-gamma-glutamyl-phosphate reductase [Candidatus Methylomirabilis sp.]
MGKTKTPERPDRIRRVAIAGASGYTGVELLRFLVQHPQVKVVSLTAETYANQPIGKVFPSLAGFLDLTCLPLDTAKLAAEAEFVFLALPHKTSMAVGLDLIQRGTRVLDLSADYRLKDPMAYPSWYGVEHVAPHLLKEAAYGLPELHRDEIAAARLVAVPGCYPTGAVLGLAPLVAEGTVDPDTVIIDSISGVSGAGRKAELPTHYSEANENLKAYGVAKHRHTPEIEQELSRLAGREVTVSFTPHLAPLTRGILTTITASLQSRRTAGDLLQSFRRFYKDSAFVRVLEEGRLPETKHVLHSNLCDIGLVPDARTGRVIVVTAIDNLVKGASGQAVQCFNLMAGLDERAGLWVPGLFP